MKRKTKGKRTEGEREGGRKEKRKDGRKKNNVSALVSKAGGPDTKLPVLGVRGGGVNFLKVLIKS